MIILARAKIRDHRMCRGARNIQQLLVPSLAPHGQQPANNDPAVEEVRKVRRVLKRKSPQLSVPNVNKESSSFLRAGQISLVAGNLEQINQTTGGVPADLGRDGPVLPCFSVVIAGEAPRRFRNPGVE